MKLDRATLIGMVALSAISTDLYLSGIPQIVADFGASAADGQLTLGVFIIGIAIGQIFYGPISDFYGRKPVLYFGLSIYICASLGCALAQNIEQLLLARLFQALAAASGPVLARAIVTDLYERGEAAKIMAVLTASMALVPTIAPMFGSWLLYLFDWRSQFLSLTIVGAAILVSSFLLPESFPRRPGAKLSFTQVGKQFVMSLRNPVFVSYALIGGAQFGAMFSWISVASFVVIEQFSVSPEHFGYTFAAVVLGYVAGAAVNSRLVVRQGIFRMVGAGIVVGTLFALLMLLIALFEIPSLTLILVSVSGMFFCGGFCISNTQVAAMSLFPNSAGQASSVFGVFQYTLAAAAGTILGQFYNDTLVPLALAFCTMLAISWICLAVINHSEKINDEGAASHS